MPTTNVKNYHTDK